jgi:hypothetical protein
MKILKYITTTIILCFTLFSFLGCKGESTVVNQAAGSTMRLVASYIDNEIYVVEIDGVEYILVDGYHSVAITPKVR